MKSIITFLSLSFLVQVASANTVCTSADAQIQVTHTSDSEASVILEASGLKTSLSGPYKLSSDFAGYEAIYELTDEEGNLADLSINKTRMSCGRGSCPGGKGPTLFSAHLKYLDHLTYLSCKNISSL